jgi:hypothetical protein
MEELKAMTAKGNRRYWEPDGRRGDMRFEDKFGVWADLSSSQRIARRELGDRFQLNHFLPEDVGKIFGIASADADRSRIDDRPSR